MNEQLYIAEILKKMAILAMGNEAVNMYPELKKECQEAITLAGKL